MSFKPNAGFFKFFSFISVLLITFSLYNSMPGESPKNLFPAGRMSDTLAPEWRLKYHGIEMQSLIFLVDISKRALEEKIRPERLEEFIKSSSALTPEIISRIDRAALDVSAEKVQIVYRGVKGPFVMVFSRKGTSPAQGLVSSGIEVGDIMVEIKDPGQTNAAINEDITTSASGETVIHENRKHLVRRKGWPAYLFGLKRWAPMINAGLEPVVGGDDFLGINDKIRDYWLDAKHLRSQASPEDMKKLLAKLSSVPEGKAIADSIVRNDYKIFYYSLGIANLPTYIHAGIRTGSIHMSKWAYDGYHGTFSGEEMEYSKDDEIIGFAAVIAHEVTEINLWRQHAEKLIQEGVIDSLGTVKPEWDPTWSNGIRKWIRENCSPDGTGMAQQLDREFHKRGFEVECEIFTSWAVKNCLKHGRGSTVNVCRTIQEMIPYRRKDGIGPDGPDSSFLKTLPKTLSEKLIWYAGEGMDEALKHFRDIEGEIFLDVLWNRVSLMLARDEWDKAVDISVLVRLRDNLNKAKTTSHMFLAELEAWLDEVRHRMDTDPAAFSAADKMLLDEIRSSAKARNAYEVPQQQRIRSASAEIERGDVVITSTGETAAQGPGPEREDIPLVGIDLPDVSAAVDAARAVSKGLEGEMAAKSDASGVDIISSEKTGKGVVIFADDIVDSSAVFDMDKMAGLVGGECKLLGKIVLYAKNARKAELVERMIKDANPDAVVVTVLDEDVAGHFGGDIFRTSSVDAILRYALNGKVGIFNDPGQILGVIRGPLAKGEDADALREELRRSSIKVPVVVFQDAQKGNVYSIVQALAKLVEIRLANGRTPDGLLFMLPPITRITAALEQEYEKYLIMVRDLASAA